MKTLLQMLGLTRKKEAPKGEPVCNLSLKNDYFNRTALAYSEFQRSQGRVMTAEESRQSDLAIQNEMGVRVIYHPAYISFA